MTWLGWLILLLLIHAVSSVVILMHMALQNKEPNAQLAWLVAVFTIPVIGIGAYLLIGTDRLRLRRLRRRGQYQHYDQSCCKSSKDAPELFIPDLRKPLFRALEHLNQLPPTTGNKFTLLGKASEFYSLLRQSITEAQHQLWFCFFVWRDDAIGREFVQLLAAAAQRGVEVRILVDEIGSREVKRDLFAPVEQAGGHFSWATTLFPRRNRWFVNLRNHRKIVIVDGREAYIGGMNIGEEYLNGIGELEWNDLHVHVCGNTINQLADIFARDWYFATEEQLHLHQSSTQVTGEVLTQVVAGGPDDLFSRNERSVQALIEQAHTQVVLTTPYFVPDAPLLASLELARARGVEVHLCVSAESDMGPLVWLSRTYFPRLINAGVKIFEYPCDIHHAKMILVDDDIAMIGSINLDIRSFHLNYEVSLVVLNRATVEQLQRYLKERLQGCTPMDMQFLNQRPLSHKIREGLMRLIAPLM